MRNGKTALIVDDEPSIRYFLSVGLEDMGFDCDAADGGEAALESLSRNDYDLMMLDIRMPGIDGMEVLRRVRLDNQELPIVILSAVADPETAAHALTTLGANAFLGKPCTLGDLGQTIANVLPTESVEIAS